MPQRALVLRVHRDVIATQIWFALLAFLVMWMLVLLDRLMESLVFCVDHIVRVALGHRLLPQLRALRVIMVITWELMEHAKPVRLVVKHVMMEHLACLVRLLSHHHP